MRKMIESVGGRKVLMSILLLASGVGLDSTIGLSENMMTLLMTLMGAFVVGNIGEHTAQALGKKKQPTATRAVAPKVDLSSIEEQMNAMNQNLQLNSQASGEIIKRIQNLVAAMQMVGGNQPVDNNNPNNWR